MKYSNFNAKINLPFAGEYVLGGKLYKLNKYRGVTDAIEIKILIKAVILNPGGFLNLDQSKIINERQKKHSQSDIENYLEEIKSMKWPMKISKLLLINYYLKNFSKRQL